MADAGLAGDFLALAAGLRRVRGETPIRVSRVSSGFRFFIMETQRARATDG